MKLTEMELFEGLTPKDFLGGEQKDWIVYDDKFSKLFCIAIVRKADSKEWNLEEFVNFFDLDMKGFNEMTTLGYHTMLEASLYRNSYEYIIARHSFRKENIDKDYWKEIIPSKNFFKKATLEVLIDKKEFEKEMSLLVKKEDVRFRGKIS